MARDATNYISGFRWCGGVKQQFFGLGVGGIVAVFLFQILPKLQNVDEWLWVIVGDLPPAYIVTDTSPNPPVALRTYMREMRKWVEAAETSGSIENIIPVNAPATPEFAGKLQARLQFIESEILPLFEAPS
jgi:hypothetical protein